MEPSKLMDAAEVTVRRLPEWRSRYEKARAIWLREIQNSST